MNKFTFLVSTIYKSFSILDGTVVSYLACRLHCSRFESRQHNNDNIIEE